MENDKSKEIKFLSKNQISQLNEVSPVLLASPLQQEVLRGFANAEEHIQYAILKLLDIDFESFKEIT